MSECLGAESTDLEVVLQQRLGCTKRVRLRVEILSLVFEAWPPSQDATNVQTFALHLSKHIVRSHPFGWMRLVGTAGSMNVMVTAVKPILRRIKPSFELQ